jgi:hypothetical protein
VPTGRRKPNPDRILVAQLSGTAIRLGECLLTAPGVSGLFRCSRRCMRLGVSVSASPDRRAPSACRFVPGIEFLCALSQSAKPAAAKASLSQRPEPRLPQHRVREISASEVSSTQVGSGEVGAAQVGASEVCALENGAG